MEGSLVSEVFDRNKYQQCVAGKCDDLGDEGGHLIASIFGGPGEKLNLVPMNGNLNKGEWKKLELEWAGALSDGKGVGVKITPVYETSSVRPARFRIIYEVSGERPKAVTLENTPGRI